MSSPRTLPGPVLAAALAATLVLAACGGSDSDSAASPTDDVVAVDDSEASSAPASGTDTAEPGVRVVSALDAAATIEDAPEDLVILDVRTPEEFDEVRIDGAVMLDFYREDFADQLAALDPDVPYVLYCRSGNRSGQAGAIMSELGFTSVDDVEGGVISWIDAGLPVVGG